MLCGMLRTKKQNIEGTCLTITNLEEKIKTDSCISSLSVLGRSEGTRRGTTVSKLKGTGGTLAAYLTLFSRPDLRASGHCLLLHSWSLRELSLHRPFHFRLDGDSNSGRGPICEEQEADLPGMHPKPNLT